VPGGVSAVGCQSGRRGTAAVGGCLKGRVLLNIGEGVRNRLPRRFKTWLGRLPEKRRTLGDGFFRLRRGTGEELPAPITPGLGKKK